jgi:hypothetical protein
MKRIYLSIILVVLVTSFSLHAQFLFDEPYFPYADYPYSATMENFNFASDFYSGMAYSPFSYGLPFSSFDSFSLFIYDSSFSSLNSYYPFIYDSPFSTLSFFDSYSFSGDWMTNRFGALYSGGSSGDYLDTPFGTPEENGLKSYIPVENGTSTLLLTIGMYVMIILIRKKRLIEKFV